MIKPRFLY